MKIVLFAKEQIVEFLLPSKTFGSFCFDENNEEENKLINVETQNNHWILKSKNTVKVYDISGNYLESSQLQTNTFYILERENVKYLIYTENVFDTSFVKFKYNKNLNLTIGKTKNCNVFYDVEFLNGDILSLKYENDNIILQTSNPDIIYINKKKKCKNNYRINYGEIIQCYGIKIIVLNGIILINNPNNKISINASSDMLQPFVVNDDSNLKIFEIKEQDLYTENEYFSKSPRVRRIIQNKTIKIDTPPPIIEEAQVPLIYNLGPMLTMSMYSVMNLINTLIRISSGETTFAKSWTTLAISISMMLTTLLWPNLTKNYTKKQNRKKRERDIKKYREYLNKKRLLLEDEIKLQREILNENLISTLECYNTIVNRKIGLWSRRIEQDDFLTVRVGIGDCPLSVNFQIPEEGFTTEETTLLDEALVIAENNKILTNAPIGYSFNKKMISAIMGQEDKVKNFVNNILVQLIAFHSYEDLKIVILTNKKNEQQWEFVKYLPHNFSDDKINRFFASNFEDDKAISNYLEQVINIRKTNDKNVQHKPYYLIITDDYTIARKINIIKTLVETNDDYGFRLIICENKLGKLPSKCNNFISLGSKSSTILEDAYENQKITNFNDEIIYNMDVNILTKTLLNVPIELEAEKKSLPDMISFLEMENVGKVEQLNVINRWKENDATLSLKTEIGIDENADLMYLDIHEKYHGPHGLIAGMTGSGKSEFIITYVLSMAINYSPNDVAFILIDYKGGGLAGAFENKNTGIKLPHLAGTITNLDKAEMNRTLVSIDSEVRKRQMMFNEAKETLGESTMDIYKYQRLFKEGRLKNPIPHLIIICDEFAELKSQQPEFMDDLISIARIGRSLGVHLILATQKPSGVVNDQIWSNSKFRVCLKVQEMSDSKEMLKRPEAATLKQAGRFYLQVGYDELFALGQSAWCGAKYYPAQKTKKIVDKSIKFINNIGAVYKSVIENSENKLISQGEELNNILRHIVDAAKLENLFAQKLWLENIPEIIFVDDLIAKYNIKFYNHIVEAVIGEYDDPNNQKQEILKVNLNTDGNMIIYGSIGSDREMFIESVLYSTTTRHTNKEINYYVIDYGSESLRKFSKFPHVGDMIFSDDKEKLLRLISMIKDTILERKQLFSNYGGEYNNYIKRNKDLPLIGIIINNYDSFIESNPMIEEELISITREGQRYGIFFLIAASNDRVIKMKLKQNFSTIFTLRFNDATEYGMVLGRINVMPKDSPGRGVFKDGNSYEFQTATIVPEVYILEYFKNIETKLQGINQTKVKKIPVLPEKITVDMFKEQLSDLNNIPIGIYNNDLNKATYDFTSNLLTPIVSEKIDNITSFSKALLIELSQIEDSQLVVVDINNKLDNIKDKIKNYYSKNPKNIMDMLINYIEKIKEINNSTMKSIIYFNSFYKFIELVPEHQIITFINLLINSSGISVIIADEEQNMKKLSLKGSFTRIRNNSSGIWIGEGFAMQSIFRVFRLPKTIKSPIPNNQGFTIDGENIRLFKTIEHDDKVGE